MIEPSETLTVIRKNENQKQNSNPLQKKTLIIKMTLHIALCLVPPKLTKSCDRDGTMSLYMKELIQSSHPL